MYFHDDKRLTEVFIFQQAKPKNLEKTVRQNKNDINFG